MGFQWRLDGVTVEFRWGYRSLDGVKIEFKWGYNGV